MNYLELDLRCYKRGSIVKPSPPLTSECRLHILTITEPENGTKKVLSVQFSADGSIFVHLPYFQSSEGFLALANYKPHRSDGLFTHFESPYKTNERIKFSYHPDGRVHFSQDRRIETRVTAKTEPLSSFRGAFFTLSLVGLHGFRSASAKDSKAPTVTRCVTDCCFTEKVRGVNITGFIVPATETAFDIDCALLASRQHLDYSVAISASAHEPPNDYNDTHMLFVGGLVRDQGESSVRMTRQALLAAYPPGAARHIFDKLSSVDRSKRPDCG